MRFQLVASILLVSVGTVTLTIASPDPCAEGHRGILIHADDYKDLSKGCQVTALVMGEHLKLFRGNKEYAKFSLDEIETPIDIVPESHWCLAISLPKKEPEVLCCDNKECRDAWWMAISKQILCRHQGKMRNEVAGEPTVEEEQELVLEEVVETPDAGGVNIRIDEETLKEKPTVKISRS